MNYYFIINNSQCLDVEMVIIVSILKYKIIVSKSVVLYILNILDIFLNPSNYSYLFLRFFKSDTSYDTVPFVPNLFLFLTRSNIIFKSLFNYYK